MIKPGNQLLEAGGLRYLLSLPPGKPSRKWPVLCFLHGLDEGPPTEIRIGVVRHGPLRPGSSPRAIRDFIIAAPQLPARGDLWRFHAEAVFEIVQLVQSRYGGDPARTYLTGFSFGGNGVFDLALTDPLAWAALWAVDPTRVPIEDPGLPVWFSSGEASRRRGRSFMERLRLQPREAAGDGDRIYVDEGLDHTGTANSAYRNDDIYEWLLSKRRV